MVKVCEDHLYIWISIQYAILERGCSKTIQKKIDPSRKDKSERSVGPKKYLYRVSKPNASVRRSVLRNINEDRTKRYYGRRNEQGFCRMHDGRFEGIRIKAKPHDQKAPNEDIKGYVQQENNDPNGLQTSKSERD